jgi:hypothetical protein
MATILKNPRIKFLSPQRGQKTAAKTPIPTATLSTATHGKNINAQAVHSKNGHNNP